MEIPREGQKKTEREHQDPRMESLCLRRLADMSSHAGVAYYLLLQRWRHTRRHSETG